MKRKRILNLNILITRRMSPYDSCHLDEDNLISNDSGNSHIKSHTPIDWKSLYWLVQTKLGPVEGDYVEYYLKDLMAVPDLRLATPIQYKRALRTLMQMPNKNIN